ncbi:TAP42-like family protein [Coniella lustricola]|uniref:TAP42-like family protein n=1 Tax=Coniella lustricola TaxID=2025994 RepID=A0A2T3A327_9PEZI|nr:TAP42-like family protein [Coniella lustricola]
MDESKSLKQLFAEAEDGRLALEGAYEVTDANYSDVLTRAIQNYTRCLDLLSQLRIFSPNESLDDLATSDLPYLLVHYHLAELTQKIPSTSPHDRRELVARSRACYERFLLAVDSYGLLEASYAKMLESYTEDPTAFTTTPSSDPALRRNAKIANYKAEQSLKQKLAYLRRHPTYGDPDAAEEEHGGIGSGDEEIVRKVHLANLALSVHSTFQQLESLNREAEILAQAPEPLLPQASTVEEDERRRRETLRQDGYSDRLDARVKRLQSYNGPLLNKEGRPLQPFTLVGGSNNRQDLAKGVFRPGHNLPTMSIDEYLEEERRRGGIIEGGGEASWHRPEPNEDDIDKADEETMKARAWDEFVEANPKGSGNTLNRG